MKKFLFPFLLIAAAATASAHCGTCGAGDEQHADTSEAPAVCPAHAEKPACAKKDAEAKAASCPVTGETHTCPKQAEAAEDVTPAEAAPTATAPVMPCCASESKSES